MRRSLRYRQLVSALAFLGVSTAVLTGCSASGKSVATSQTSSVTSTTIVARAVFPKSSFSAHSTVSPSHSTTLSLSAGASVTLSSGSAPAGAVLSATSTSPPHIWNWLAQPLRAPVRLGLSTGKIHGTATLEFPYNPASVPRGVPVAQAFGVATYNPVRGVWVDHAVVIDTVHHLLIATVRHFSWWAAWTWNWADIGAKISQDVLSILGKRTSPPSCQSGVLPAYVQDVVTVASPDSPLYSCAENAEGTLEIKMVDNRNYADVLTFGAPVSVAHHDNGGNPLQYAVSKLIGPHLGHNQLYIPPLAGGYVEIPDTPFQVAVFKAGPTIGTLFADVAQLALGAVNLAKIGGFYTKIALACGQFLSGASVPTSEPAVTSLIESSSGCLEKVIAAVANTGGLDARTLTQLDEIGGTLTFLDHLNVVGTTINVASELGDLVLGATVDRRLRQFTVYHIAVASTTTAVSTTGTSLPSTTAQQGGSAKDTTCEEFSQLDDDQQQVVVQEMMDELGPSATEWGVNVVLPNVRAMCSMYPPNTPISAVF